MRKFERAVWCAVECFHYFLGGVGQGATRPRRAEAEYFVLLKPGLQLPLPDMALQGAAFTWL
jgi:hypothetical protein